MPLTQNDKIVIKDSKLSGKGLFAGIPFRKNQTVMRIKGEVFSLRKFFAVTQTVRDNTIRFGESEYISPAGELGLYLNHSCDPNCKLVKKSGNLYLVAIKNIPKGKELAFDYTTTIAQDDYWVMKCNCLSKKCRMKIKRYNLLPKKTLQEFLTKRLIPSYILDIPKD
jgi:hypothetical protein